MSEIKKDKHPSPQKEENLLKWREKIGWDMVKDEQNYNLEDIYEHAHSELSLQQSKRDQIITIYLALCSFRSAFSKAWFLHMYYDEATPDKTNTETEEKKQA